MVKALGYSLNEFNPADPGRLCRGRERWIEPWEEDEPPPELRRLVISGAAFSDDSARDALRGVHHSGVDVPAVLDAIFPGRTLLAFMEDGHPADLPEGATGVELYPGHRAGGLVEEMLVRWYRLARGGQEVRDLIGDDPNVDRVRGFAVLPEGGVDHEELWNRLFLLVGMGTLDSPPARFQPLGLVDVLELVDAVVLVHADKHGPALGIYSRDPIALDGRLAPLCEAVSALLVPFAIPPMLARWDRALAEARADWEAARSEPFPVPASAEPSTWEPRWRRRQRKKEDADFRRGFDGEDDGDVAEDEDVGDAPEGDEPDEGDGDAPEEAEGDEPYEPEDEPEGEPEGDDLDDADLDDTDLLVEDDPEPG